MPPEGLDDEVAHHPAVLRVHPGTVGVEDSGHLDGKVVLPMVVEEERLGASFPLVVAGADSDGVDVAPILLRLGVNLGIAVDFARRSL